MNNSFFLCEGKDIAFDNNSGKDLMVLIEENDEVIMLCPREHNNWVTKLFKS